MDGKGIVSDTMSHMGGKTKRISATTPYIGGKRRGFQSAHHIWVGKAGEHQHPHLIKAEKQSFGNHALHGWEEGRGQ